MPRYKMHKTNYRNLVDEAGLSSDLYKSYKDVAGLAQNKAEIERDLPRTAFVGFADHKKKDMDKYCVENNKGSYTQGDMNGFIFSAIWQDFILHSPKFILPDNEDLGKDQNEEQRAAINAPGTVLPIAPVIKLSFAYFVHCQIEPLRKQFS